jgi:YidC/Oxa1 family membrane protein insertase
MALYKANKVNPLSGCLPMLLQMPIWFALYRTLNVAAELYQAPFINGWTSDLTRPDPFYILPVALMVMMFVQARITPSSGDSAQQKMMQYGLPLVFGVFGFFFPAGLTLYIFTNTALSALHGVYIRRTDPAGPALRPAPAVAAAAPVVEAKGEPKAETRTEGKGGGGGGKGGGGGGKRKKNRRS